MHSSAAHAGLQNCAEPAATERKKSTRNALQRAGMPPPLKIAPPAEVTGTTSRLIHGYIGQHGTVTHRIWREMFAGYGQNQWKFHSPECIFFYCLWILLIPEAKRRSFPPVPVKLHADIREERDTHLRGGVGRVGHRCGGVNLAAVDELQRLVEGVVSDAVWRVDLPQNTRARPLDRRWFRRHVVLITRTIVYTCTPQLDSISRQRARGLIAHLISFSPLDVLFLRRV